MTRFSGIVVFFSLPFALLAQGGDKDLRTNADELFAKGEYAAAFQPYQTLLGNNQQDFDLNFRYGVCALHGGADKVEAIKYLKRATLGPAPPSLAWYFLGKAYHLSYEFKEALVAYERFRGTADKKMLSDHPVDALELQCRNGQNLLSNLKEIDVHNKMEVEGSDFFRFYDLSSIGGKIVVTPDELKSPADKKARDLALVYLPDKGGPIYFASYGKGGGTGRDIYRSELLPTGEFAAPVKLAGYINTDQDEDFPFMAPDGRSFYFCSKGHNSMGGYDVFKSTYDKGMDVFGAPVNMDFAVNTPDDDLLYLTDPEGKEACFASSRDSKQGTVHVYRVSTAQAPVSITVLKGTFSSQFDQADRKARIVVQDALTQANVADVNTDMNGNYVLSLPRSGKYRFLVEAGPGGKTHAGVVDIPRNEEPRAYRQEMSLVDQGGEKLMIRNYFDQPLDEDLIALALDEIKRRAKLDVGPPPVVSEQKPEEQPTDDPLTRAGFAGNLTKADVQRLADEDAAYLRKSSDDLEHQSVAAYSIALENAAIADGFTARAESLVAQANAEVDEKRKNDLMVEAALERQNARAANQRATAALRAGESLTADRMQTELRAQKAQKLGTDLTRSMADNDQNAMVIKLVELRTRLEEKNAPDGTIGPAERMRRTATEREKEAAAALTRANAARGEENELVDRIARKKREEDEAKGNKKENAARERADLETQLKAMRDENDRAFAKARIAEQESGNAQGQAALAKHLSTAAAGMTVNELPEDQKQQLAARISSTGKRISAIALDERFDAAIAMKAREVERRTFDWGAPITAGTGDPVASTRTMERDTSDQAMRAESTTTMVAQADLAEGRVRDGGAVQAPDPLHPGGNITNNDAAGSSEQGQGSTTAPQPVTGAQTPIAPNGAVLASGDSSTAKTADPGSSGQVPDPGQARPEGTGNDSGLAGTINADGTIAQNALERSTSGVTSAEANGSSGAESSGGAGKDGLAANQPDQGTTTTNSVDSRVRDGAPPAGSTDQPGRSRSDTDLASMKGVVTPVAENGAPDTAVQPDNNASSSGAQQAKGVEDGAIIEEPSANVAAESAEDRAFAQANELAELRQLRGAEKNRARRDSLDVRIAELQRAMRASVASEQIAGSGEPGKDMQPGQQNATEQPVSQVPEPNVGQQVVSAPQPDAGGKAQADQRDAPVTDGSGITPAGNQDPAVGADVAVADGTERPISSGEPEPLDGAGSTRPMLTFDPSVGDSSLTAGVYPEYNARKRLMERELDDVKERSAALHGLELMLVDSIDAENTRQLDRLEQHPNESAEILKRVDRLRVMKDQHLRQADDALAMADRQYVAGESRAMEDAALSSTTTERGPEEGPIAVSTTPHNDGYVAITGDREQVYSSIMDYRADRITDAIRERDRDLTALADLEDRIDSLEGVLESMPVGKAQSKLRDRTDKLIDDRMILRTELGQRMGYITRNEFEALQDSARRLGTLTAQQGLKPDEPMLSMAASLERSAAQGMKQAGELRKRADRSEDIVLRDSLFRTAYIEELTALREMDRAITVRNYVQEEVFTRGERITYEQVEQRMFGADQRPVIAQEPSDPSVAVDAARTRAESTNAATGAPVNTLSDLGTTATDPVGPTASADVDRIRTEAARAAELSRELEAASIASADRANTYQDSASTAKRAQRERLLRLALRERDLSDSLHLASMRANELAAELGRKAGDAQDAFSFQERLLKYYYLNDQEQAIVLNEEDRSRYFQARAKALEQREQALRAQERSASTEQLADALLQESKEILQNPNPGGAALTPDQMEKARLLTDQAVRLNQRADSLSRAAERLGMAAKLNEAQAGAMLQALTPERGTEIMAMEQRTRRVESVLAQARSLQGSVNAVQSPTEVATTAQSGGATANKAGADPAAAPGQTTADQPVGTPTGALTLQPDNNAGATLANTTSTAVAPVDRSASPVPDAGTPRLLPPLTADLFSLETAAPRTGPIPIDAPMPAGVVYKVQIGAFKQDIPDELFSDLAPVTGEHLANGLTRYAVGMFTSPEGAVKATETVRQRGYRDAFVVAYQDGRRVSLTQAMRAARPVSAGAPVTAELPASGPVRIAAPTVAVTTAPSDSVLVAEQAVLVNYPATAEEVLAQFAPPTDATTYYDVPGAAPARQVETVKGLFFTVQVGVYSKPTALDKLFNITPLNSERTENLKIRYTTGVFTDMDKARTRKDQTVGLGVKDAFITAYLNGKRIPMRDARALIARFGTSVFVEPSIVTR